MANDFFLIHSICGKSVSLTGRLITLVKKSKKKIFFQEYPSRSGSAVVAYLPMQELNYFALEKV
jgi:hypothetical protein